MDVPERLRPLLTARCATEAAEACADPADLEQAVWLRWLEHTRTAGAPPEPEGWLSEAVRTEARHLGTRAHREIAHDPSAAELAGEPGPSAERRFLAAERSRAVREAIPRLPGRCPRLLAAMLSPRDLTYREIAGELGISQGSLGPLRSRCLGCLRRMLVAEVGIPPPGGKVR
ncbi:sigma-70 family RNA polymerase sigma factor [Streptomyces sp. 549]|uniref:RNA polymerase sigma factor n=1 Tax=Streptomyces sp. 549 TaxID=3049076 RepID=UPI0024C251F9|nr:sigma-70 family RNA polymerase sigma factor [Streptomyces sp. 549]MDK1473457.1 sigma-70 family RNA polymerase sigma factor [Streptomyces sp. 549]